MTWRRTSIQRGPHGEQCERYDSVEYPRVYRLVQSDADGVVRDLYYVDGINANYWHTADEALQAARANP